MTDKELLERMLSWRGIDAVMDDVCRDCDGSGVKTYGSTATWMGGIGGQAMTASVCDKCWGSGATNRPGPNLREVMGRCDQARRAASELDEYQHKIRAEYRAKLELVEKQRDAWRKAAEHMCCYHEDFEDFADVVAPGSYTFARESWELVKAARELMEEKNNA